MTQAKPRRLTSRTFVGTKERENFSFLAGLGAGKRRFWSCHDVRRREDSEPWFIIQDPAAPEAVRYVRAFPVSWVNIFLSLSFLLFKPIEFLLFALERIIQNCPL